MDHPFWSSKSLVIDVWSLKSESVQIWTEATSLCWLTLIDNESPWDDYKCFVDNFINFLENLGSPILDAWV
jgi:hypothetical protein